MNRGLENGSGLSEDAMAVMAIAMEMLTDLTPPVEESREVTPAWRFSGRWFDDPQRFL